MLDCSRRFRRLTAAAAILASAGCAPRLVPLVGSPVPARLPAAVLAPGHHRIVFTWELNDGDLVARGDGAARLASPDSARLDFFLAGGLGTGAAILVGDDLRLPGGDPGSGLIPPAPLLWAALGRLALPSSADTIARMEGSTIRADLGNPVAWRVVFEQGRLSRVERVSEGRVREWVTRTSDGHIRYHNESDRRTLDLVITTSNDTEPFDAAIWSFP